MVRKKTFNFNRTFSRLKSLDVTAYELHQLARFFVKRLGNHRAREVFSKTEFQCLRYLFNYSTRVPGLFAEHLAYKRKIIAAEEALLSPGSDETRMRAALKILGLGIVNTKKSKYRSMKVAYEMLFTDEGQEKNGRRRIAWGHNDMPKSTKRGEERFYIIEWGTIREKKIAIIEAIRKAFNAKSRNSVIQQLRILNTINLPSLEGSGMYKK